MRKLADLYFDRRDAHDDFTVKSHENMKKEDQGMVEDLMRNNRVTTQINNACKDVMKMQRGDVDTEVSTFEVNLGSTSIEAKLKIQITLLKLGDDNDLKISLFSLVNVPQM